MDQLGKLIIITGGVLIVVGIVVMFADRLPWIGRLPGDMYVKRGNFHFYFPLATSIIISILLTLVLWLARYIKR